MQKQFIKTKIITSLFWKLMERGGTQGIQFIVQIVLARILLPEDYGILALVTVFIVIASLFIQSGLNTALIQKKNADNRDFSAVLYLSLFIAGILYIVIFFISPYIASFYNTPEITTVLRILSITLFFGAFNSIQNAYVSKKMIFKKLFLSSIISSLGSGILGIAMAYFGYGVWALVAQQLFSQILITITLWFTVQWRPILSFSFQRVSSLFKFGWKILVSNLLNQFFMDVRTLVIGKIFTPEMVGFYNRGKQFPQLISSNINGSIQSVMLPALSSQQDDLKRVKSMMRRSVMTSSFIVFPMMIGLAAIAEPLVILILTEKWTPAVIFLQIYCLIYALKPINTANAQAINAIGRSDIFLKLEIIRSVIGFLILIISIPFGIYAIAWGSFVSSLISSYIYVYPNKKLLHYGYLEQLKDVIPSLMISLLMGIVVYLLNYFDITIWMLLIFQIICGIVLYIGLSKIFKLDSFNYVNSTAKQLVRKKMGKNVF